MLEEIDRAERRRHRQAAGKILGPAHGMAIVAIADRRQLTAAFDEGGIEDCGAGGSIAAIAGRQATAKAAAAPTTSTTAAMLATIRADPVIRSPLGLLFGWSSNTNLALWFTYERSDHWQLTL